MSLKIRPLTHGIKAIVVDHCFLQDYVYKQIILWIDRIGHCQTSISGRGSVFFTKNKQIKNYPVQFSYHFYSNENIMENLQELNGNEEPAWVREIADNKLSLTIDKETENVVNTAMDIIEYDYPYQLSTITTNYQSVSEVKQLFVEPNNEKLAKIDWTDESRINRYTRNSLERPKFLQEETTPKPAEVGQATHFLLQHIDFNQKITAESIKKTIQQMIEEGVMRKEVALNIDIEKIAQYFQTPFGQEIIEHQADLEKEVLFSLMMEARDVFTGMETVDDPILIHGIIDGYFKREEGIVLFDYKTDHVAHLGKQAEKELVRRYRGQLILYKQALESIIKRPVIETNIISLDLTKTISVHP